MTYCIIMAGGAGSRFWPLSNEDYPKQFIDLIGNGESMIQSTFRRCAMLCPRENIIIVTAQQYALTVREQIPDLLNYQVLCEPCRRNTAPCIAYAAAIIANRDPDATILVTPSDHAIFNEDNYISDIRQALAVAQQNPWIITIGAQPTSPNSKYGYIQFDEDHKIPQNDRLRKVVTFTEKPPIEVARQFIATGEFYWNVGIFVWSLNTLRKAYHDYLPGISETFFSLSARTAPEELERIYSLCESVSVDHGIMEHADNVHVMGATFGWSDVETWDTLYNTCSKDSHGNVFASGNVFAYDVHNCVVHLPQDKTLVLQGLDGYIVTGDNDVVMVCRRDQECRLVKFASDVELDRLRNR
ncbi:MAG: mannose-1-phosphate guanylyltransferase [Bacteroidales bacterium]|nr:mannose-1-phosphate guanylyltransferase [Candidatus Colimorpha onthohippi]